jgi:ABC-type uncharacterized transport system substrate-binding protein
MAGLPLAVSLLEFGTSEADIRAAVESISRDGANAVMVLDSPQVLQNSTLIAKLLGDAKLPAIFAFTESVEAGGLMAYSFDLIELHKRAALDIDAILRGAKTRRHPDLPSNQIRVVHQPQHSQAAGAFRTSCAHRECRQGNRVNNRRSSYGP